MRKKYILFVLLTLIGFFIRVSLIQFGLPSKNLALSTYNPDEQNNYHTLEKWNIKKFYFPSGQVLHWGNLQLFFLAGSLGMAKLFGYVKFRNREFYINNLKEADKLYIVGRLISIFFGSLSIFMLILFAKNLYGDSFAFFSGVILTILPMHVINSIYVRPDIIMMFFCIMILFFSLQILDCNEKINYILAGIFCGLGIAAKYSCGSYVFLPIIADIVKNKKIVFHKNIFIFIICTIISFIVGCPYVILEPKSFYAAMKHLIGLSQGVFIEELGFVPAFWRYLTWFLPYGFGFLLFLVSLFGFILLCIKKDKKSRFIIISFLIVFFLTTRPKFQSLWHTFPVVPFFVIFAAEGLNFLWSLKTKFLKILSKTAVILIILSSLVYTLGYWRLYKEKNVREEASEWIEKNIPKGARVAIARSYFWTPPVLRQYNPPYKVLMGADSVKSSVQEGVLGLKNLLDETEYVVLTEYEFRWALHPKLQKYFSKHKKILDEIFYSGKFIKLAEFDKEAKFLVFKFKKNYPPGDWLIPNPRIIIFKKV